MAGQASRLGAQNGLDAINGRATQTARTTYLVLLTAAPGSTTTLATMSEVTTAGYARQSVTWGAPSAADPAVAANTNLITFGAFTADPPNVTHLALVSAASGTTGDFIYYWTADVARDAASGDSIQVAIGALTMSL